MARLDRNQFDRLVREQHAAVYRSALRVLRHSDDAEDTAQEVFVRALAGRVPLGAGSERASLCWLATRLALNTLRGKRRRHDKEQRATMPDNATDPALHAADRERRQAVQRSIDELPDGLRLPLLLRYQDELTFAAIGSALAISESTAHERVQTAVQRLRRDNLAVAGAALPELLATEAAAVPAGLEARLLALGTATKVVAAGGSKQLLALLLLGGGAITAISIASFGERPPAAAPATVTSGGDAVERVDVPASVRRAAAPPNIDAPRTTAQDPAVSAVVTFTGTVHDALAWPSSNVRVQAVAAGRLKPFEIASTTTDAAGAFRLEVPRDGGPVTATTIRIRVLEHENVLLQTDEQRLPRDRAPQPLDLRLPATVGTETSRFALVVTVRGSDGAPLANVPVALYAATEPPPRPTLTAAESEAVTDAFGVARLGGRQPGARVLFADGRKLGLRAATVTVAVERPGESSANIELADGLRLQGRAGTVDGALLPWANLWIEDEITCLYHPGSLAADGAFEFANLGDGPFTLHIDSQGLSPVTLTGLRPGAAPIEIALKRSNDVRDHGQHMAELHGRLIDAATGAAVDFGDHDVTVRRVLGGESTLPMDLVEAPRPVQILVTDERHDAFHLVGLTAGRWAVQVNVGGYAAAVQLVEVRDRELRTDLEVALHRPATVRGRVVDADGKAVAGAFVFVTGFGNRAEQNVTATDLAQQDPSAAPQAERSALACATRAGADGAFELDGVPPGVRLRVVAVAAGHAWGQSPAVEMRPGQQQEDCELRLGRR